MSRTVAAPLVGSRTRAILLKDFGTPSTISTGLVLRSAAFGGDALSVAMVSAGEPYNPSFGPLYSQRFALGSPGPATTFSA